MSMNRIIALEKSDDARESVLRDAYYNGFRMNNDYPNFKTIIHDSDVKYIIPQCHKYNIKKVSISACYVGLMDALWEFQNRGAIIEGMITINYDKMITAPAILISLDTANSSDNVDNINKSKDIPSIIIKNVDTEDNEEIQNTPDEIITVYKDSININNDNTKNNSDSDDKIKKVEKQKRHRRTKYEMEIANELTANKANKNDVSAETISSEQIKDERPKRHRRTKAEMEEFRQSTQISNIEMDNNENVDTNAVETQKPKRHRRTKAEMEEARNLIQNDDNNSISDLSKKSSKEILNDNRLIIPEQEIPNKPKRHRRTKAEMEAAKMIAKDSDI